MNHYRRVTLNNESDLQTNQLHRTRNPFFQSLSTTTSTMHLSFKVFFGHPITARYMRHVLGVKLFPNFLQSFHRSCSFTARRKRRRCMCRDYREICEQCARVASCINVVHTSRIETKCRSSAKIVTSNRRVRELPFQ